MTWKLNLHTKLKYSPKICVFELRFIIIAWYMAAIKVKKTNKQTKKQSTSTLRLMRGPSVHKAVRRLWKKQSFSFFIYIHVNDCIIRRCLFTLSFHENWVLNCFSVTWYGEGKRRNEFAEWHAAWLVEWYNYVECNICGMTQRNKLNWKGRLFWRKINPQTLILTYDYNQ